MIPTYSDYIREYTSRLRSPGYPLPGEHHFVAAYLVPRLVEKFGVVPDYINPDGTKAVLGDVVYYRDKAHHFGIEVKCGVVRLTRNEFNSWIVATQRQRWPNVFVGVCNTGMICGTWSAFRDSYIATVRRFKKDEAWRPEEIAGGYGPMPQVKLLTKVLRPGLDWFPVQDDGLANTWEDKFIDCLTRHSNALEKLRSDTSKRR